MKINTLQGKDTQDEQVMYYSPKLGSSFKFTAVPSNFFTSYSSPEKAREVLFDYLPDLELCDLIWELSDRIPCFRHHSDLDLFLNNLIQEARGNYLFNERLLGTITDESDELEEGLEVLATDHINLQRFPLFEKNQFGKWVLSSHYKK